MDHKEIRDRDWYQGVKDIRGEQNVGIFAAEKIMLEDQKWRRWIALRVRKNDRCLKQARYHVAVHGSESLFELEGRKIVFPETK